MGNVSATSAKPLKSRTEKSLKGNKESFVSLSLLWIIPVLVVVAWLYAPTSGFGFLLWDDDKYIVDNTALLSSGIADIAKATVAGNYHPLTLLSLKWNLSQSGLKPGPFHEWNTYLHLLNTLLIFVLFLSYRLQVIPAVAAALCFGVHPLHVESVAWISERKDVLYTAFFLLSWIAWKNPLKWKPGISIGLSLMFFLASCLSKGMAIVLPFVLLMEVWLFQKPGARKDETLKLIPYFLISILFAWLAIWAQETVGAIRQSTDYTIWDKLVFPFYGVSFYLGKMVLPLDLSAVYPYPLKPSGILPWTFLISIPFMLILTLLLYVFRKQKWLLFAFVGYVICLLPVLQILPVGNAITADRYFYVSSVPLFLGLIIFLQEKINNKYIYYGVLFLPGLLWVVPARERVMVWKDTLSLFSDVVKKHPQVAVGHYNMGNIYMNDQRNYPAAIEAYQKAIQARPDYADAWTNLGVSLQYLSNYREAINALLVAVRLNPGHVEAHNNLGVGYEKIEKTDSAIYHYQIAMNLNPGKVELYNNVGYALDKIGKMDSAVFYYQKALEIKSDYAVAMVNLGNALIKTGRPQAEADVWFIKAARNGHQEAREYLKGRGVEF
jgi:tetratricopeptide (TPR) repeat protein